MQRKEQLKTEVIPTNEEEAEEFAKAIMQRAASLKVVKINRGDFLRSEIKRRFPEIDADFAVETTPAETGIAPEDLDRMAIDVIDLETKKCAGLSFLAGIPGGLAVVGTVPADLAQYFAHVMRIEQKLAYIYGWQTFLNEEDEVDDETVMKLVVLMGVMMQVGGAANAVTTFAANTARAGIEKAIQKQALTKTFWYNPMKKVLRYLGVNLTKQTFAKTASKVVPVIGGAISGGMTYRHTNPAQSACVAICARCPRPESMRPCIPTLLLSRQTRRLPSAKKHWARQRPRPSTPHNRSVSLRRGPHKQLDQPRSRGSKRLGPLPRAHWARRVESLAPSHRAPKQAGPLAHPLPK